MDITCKIINTEELMLTKLHLGTITLLKTLSVRF